MPRVLFILLLFYRFVIKYTDPDYMTMLQEAIQEGKPALLENVGEELDPGKYNFWHEIKSRGFYYNLKYFYFFTGLEAVLLKQTFMSESGVECILLGDTVIEYTSGFKLYIVTDLRNPHFAPEVAVKVSNILCQKVG